MSEPTVLDYFKAKLTFWRRTDLRIPDIEPVERAAQEPVEAHYPDGYPAGHGAAAGISYSIQPGAVEPVLAPEDQLLSAADLQAAPKVIEAARPFPWRASASLVLALVAQRALDPPSRSVTQGVILYALSAVCLVWGVFSGEWKTAPLQPDERHPHTFWARRTPLLAALPLAVLTYLVFSKHLFTIRNGIRLGPDACRDRRRFLGPESLALDARGALFSPQPAL